MVKKILLVIKSAPYASGGAAEGLRMATAMIAMDVLPHVLFLGDGVYCLLKNQKPEYASLPPPAERLKTLADLVGIFALSDSLAERKLRLNDLNEGLSVRIRSLDEAAELISESESVITF